MTRTVVAQAYGGPEVLVLQDIELPDLADGQVRVDVRAAGTNPFDYKSYSGDMGDDPARLPLPVGSEVSGVVAAVTGRRRIHRTTDSRRRGHRHERHRRIRRPGRREGR